MAEGEHASDGGAPVNQEAGAQKKKSGSRRVLIIGLLVAVLAAIGVYVFLTRNEVETDDAYTEGRKIAVAPHVNGYVTQLLVNDNQFVHAGDLLMVIDDRDYAASLHKAQAAVQQALTGIDVYRTLAEVARKDFPGRLVTAQGNLASAQATLVKAEADYRRQRIVSRAATSQQDIDTARAALDEAKARVVAAQGQLTQAEPVIPNVENAHYRVTQEEATLASAKADLEQAELNMGWTRVRAPHDGWIAQRNVEQGSYVQTGAQMFSIVEPEIWVVANYKETQLTRMRAGQKVDISVDAYPSLKLHGHVDSLQLGSGEAFSTFPPQNATGNFVKTVQRIPVKILIDGGLDPKLPLAIGLSVIPTVHVE